MKPIEKAELVSTGLLVLCIAFLAARTSSLKRSNAALALRAYNDSAALDTSRALNLSRKDSLRILGDSLNGTTKLVVQRTQERDALDRALGIERTAKVALEATIKGLQVTKAPSVAPVVIDSQDVRHASFHVEQSPFTVQLGVSVPKAGAATMDSLKVRVDSAAITLRIGCQAPNRDGVRPARVTATAPTWLTVGITSAEQDKDVCQGVVAQRSSWFRGLFSGFAPELYLGVGASINPLPMIQGKPAEISPAIQVGVSLVRIPLRIPWP